MQTKGNKCTYDVPRLRLKILLNTGQPPQHPPHGFGVFEQGVGVIVRGGCVVALCPVKKIEMESDHGKGVGVIVKKIEMESGNGKMQPYTPKTHVSGGLNPI